MSVPNEYCGSTPIDTIYTACNMRNPDGTLSSQEVMRQNYECRLKKIMFTFDLKGQSAGGGNYAFPDYSKTAKQAPKYVNPYNTFNNVYKNYDVKPSFL